MANRIVFTRLIQGVAVVGQGSKVVITLLNDGTLESLQYDWPSYAPATSESLLGAPDIVSRIQKVLSLRTGQRISSAVSLPPSSAANPFPIDLGSSMSLVRLEYGYYDPGQRIRAPGAPVQAGRYYHVVHTASGSGGSLRGGLSGAVPAAVSVQADNNWPEAQMLLGQTTSGSTPPPSAKGP